MDVMDEEKMWRGIIQQATTPVGPRVAILKRRQTDVLSTLRPHHIIVEQARWNNISSRFIIHLSVRSTETIRSIIRSPRSTDQPPRTMNFHFISSQSQSKRCDVGNMKTNLPEGGIIIVLLTSKLLNETKIHT